MKFMIDRASFGADDKKPCEGAIKLKGGGYGIKIEKIEDLMKIIEETGFPIIVYGQSHNYHGSLPVLNIYDDYIE